MEHWVEEIEGWETRPVAAGLDGLRSLAAADFSGAVSAGEAWLFLVNGRGVGVFEYAGETAAAAPTVSRGSLDALDGADLTAYVAPHHSIPLLIAMQAGETTTRARYYTEDTPIPEVHETLIEGGFTGYLELSENVLSGDYYVVYQAGRSAEVAFIGNSRRVETDEEAFERACDEVGIYEVVAASIEPVDLPEPEPEPEPESEPESDPATGATAAGTGATGGADPDPEDEGTGASATGRPERTDAAGDAARDASGTADAGASSGARGTAGAEGAADDSGDASSTLDSLGSLDDLDEFAGTSDSADDAGSADADDGADGTGAAGSVDAPDAETGIDADRGDDAAPGDDRAADDASTADADLVPAITEVDADAGTATEPADGEAPGDADAVDAADAAAGASADAGTTTAGSADAGTASGTSEDGDGGSDGTDTAAATGTGGAAALRDRLEEREAELDSVRRERDELAERVSKLEAAVEELHARDAAPASGAAADGEALSGADALAGTNLFVRYRSKGAATLSDAVEGAASREELADNLRIEHHTGFEAAGATVDGEPFEAWLTDTHQFRFLRWLVTALPFEIRETGSREALRDLHGALPEIDRVELDGSVPIGEGESETFDLVALDQMGDPLVVAEIDPDREPVAETGVADLVRSATSVAEAHPDLAGAFHVTEAFFRPRAMETAREATSDSLLSRDSRRSFVKISRNRGYHLCLVEARDDSYYLSVPDL